MLPIAQWSSALLAVAVLATAGCDASEGESAGVRPDGRPTTAPKQPTAAPVGARLQAGPQQRPVATLSAPRRVDPIRIDGHLDEPQWATAGRTGNLVNTMRGTAGAFGAQVRILYDSQALYVAFEVQDDDLRTRFTAHDDHLWEQDTVEVMIEPDGDLKNYYELQVSPRGILFDTQYDTRRRPRPFGHVNWSSNVQSGVHVDGTLDDTAPDRGYTVEMRIPIESLQANGVAAPIPKPGGAYRLNFFVMNSVARGQLAVGWSAPLVGDFHKIDRFGVVTFGD